MRIDGLHTDEDSLAEFGAQAVRLLRSYDFSRLAEMFGYAVALGRDPCAAIRDDLASSLSELNATELDASRTHATTVSYFEKNASGLLAII